MGRKRASAPVEETAQLTKVQAFESARIHRREINGAPYNPRFIAKDARKELEGSLKRFGLITPITVNKRNGMIVGGHQRLDLIDGIEGSDDYLLDVSLVDMSESDEMEANVILNNRNAQGDWDYAKLGELYTSGKMKFDRAAFHAVDLHAMFDDTVYGKSMFAPMNQAPQVAQDLAVLSEMSGKSSAGSGMGDVSDVPSSTDPALGGAKTQAEKDAEVKAHRAEFKANAALRNEDADTDFQIVVVCADRRERDALLFALGAAGEKYIASTKLMATIGMERPTTPL